MASDRAVCFRQGSVRVRQCGVCIRQGGVCVRSLKKQSYLGIDLLPVAGRGGAGAWLEGSPSHLEFGTHVA